MLCDFARTNKQWVCKQCGRKSPINGQFMPTAKCRIPDFYHLKSNYINNKKIIGVGDTLSTIIKKIGFSYPPISSARTMLTFLNKKGIDWCEENQPTILEWFKYECKLNNIPFLEIIAKAILRLAIRKAKIKNINSL